MTIEISPEEAELAMRVGNSLTIIGGVVCDLGDNLTIGSGVACDLGDGI